MIFNLVYSDTLYPRLYTWIKLDYTYLFSPRNWVILVNLTDSQLVKKFPAFYGTWRFITAFTSACHLSISSARSVQSMPPHPTSGRLILILSSHLRLGLACYPFPSGFPTKTLYTPPLSPIRATCPAHLILPNLITRKKKTNKFYRGHSVGFVNLKTNG